MSTQIVDGKLFFSGSIGVVAQHELTMNVLADRLLKNIQTNGLTNQGLIILLLFRQILT